MSHSCSITYISHMIYMLRFICQMARATAFAGLAGPSCEWPSSTAVRKVLEFCVYGRRGVPVYSSGCEWARRRRDNSHLQLLLSKFHLFVPISYASHRQSCIKSITQAPVQLSPTVVGVFDKSDHTSQHLSPGDGQELQVSSRERSDRQAIYSARGHD